MIFNGSDSGVGEVTRSLNHVTKAVSSSVRKAGSRSAREFGHAGGDVCVRSTHIEVFLRRYLRLIREMGDDAAGNFLTVFREASIRIERI